MMHRPFGAFYSREPLLRFDRFAVSAIPKNDVEASDHYVMSAIR